MYFLCMIGIMGGWSVGPQGAQPDTQRDITINLATKGGLSLFVGYISVAKEELRIVSEYIPE